MERLGQQVLPDHMDLQEQRELLESEETSDQLEHKERQGLVGYLEAREILVKMDCLDRPEQLDPWDRQVDYVKIDIFALNSEN